MSLKIGSDLKSDKSMLENSYPPNIFGFMSRILPEQFSQNLLNDHILGRGSLLRSNNQCCTVRMWINWAAYLLTDRWDAGTVQKYKENGYLGCVRQQRKTSGQCRGAKDKVHLII